MQKTYEVCWFIMHSQTYSTKNEHSTLALHFKVIRKDLNIPASGIPAFISRWTKNVKWNGEELIIY